MTASCETTTTVVGNPMFELFTWHGGSHLRILLRGSTVRVSPINRKIRVTNSLFFTSEGTRKVGHEPFKGSGLSNAVTNTWNSSSRCCHPVFTHRIVVHPFLRDDSTLSDPFDIQGIFSLVVRLWIRYVWIRTPQPPSRALSWLDSWRGHRDR